MATFEPTVYCYMNLTRPRLADKKAESIQIKVIKEVNVMELVFIELHL